MEKTSREFQIFIKPVGSECNLRCKYCYYLEKKTLYPGSSIMNDEVLEKYIRDHIAASTEKVISFSWHGGEPLLAGIDFFRKALSYQRKYKPSGSTILNGIQTNGTLLNDEWCLFLASEKFIVGISLDGPEQLHDLHRVRYGGSPTFSEVLHGYRLLKKWSIPSEILCVVSAGNVKQPLVVYNFFKGLGAGYITFLPLVEHRPGTPSLVSPESVPPEGFGFFLRTIFDEWILKDIGKIKIQVFEEAMRSAFEQDHTLCIFKRNCGGVPVVEHNGDFYSCDHYVDANHKLGNIMDDPLSGILVSERQKEFGLVKSLTLPEYCLGCEVSQMCNGECPKNRFLSSPGGEKGLNYLCRGYKIFFSHCLPFVEAVRSQWEAGKQASDLTF